MRTCSFADHLPLCIVTCTTFHWHVFRASSRILEAWVTPPVLPVLGAQRIVHRNALTGIDNPIHQSQPLTVCSFGLLLDDLPTCAPAGDPPQTTAQARVCSMGSVRTIKYLVVDNVVGRRITSNGGVHLQGL